MKNKFVTVDMPTLIKFFMDNVNIDNMDEKGNYPINFKFDIDTFAKFIEKQSIVFSERDDIGYGVYIIDDEDSAIEISSNGGYELIDGLKFVDSLTENIKLTDKIDG